MRNNYRSLVYLNEGNSLVEMVILLCIISILLVASMPTTRALASGLIINMEAVRLAQDIRYTQQLTLTRGKKYELMLDRAENSYDIRTTGSIRRKVIKRVNLTEGVYIRYSTLYGSGFYYYIQFNSKTGLPGRTGTIYLSDRYGNTRDIIIVPTTGRVRIR